MHMHYNTYLSKIDALYSFYNAPLPKEMTAQLNVQYAFVSASLSNFLPGVQAKEHEAIYRHILLHQQISLLDEENPAYAMKDLLVENLGSYNFRTFTQCPAIFCTMHNGSYRLINFFLKQHRIPFALVANKNVINDERSRFEINFNRLYVQDGFPLSLIDAEESSSVIRMMRALKEGKSLLLYIDGNTGAGDWAGEDNQNLCYVSFLAQQLAARSGIAYMSVKTRVPVIPLIALKTSAHFNRLIFFPPIKPAAKSNNIREEIQRIMQEVYHQMSGIIKDVPGQWEGWLYVHKFAKITPGAYTINDELPATTNQVAFNSAEFIIFKMDSKFFLLHKNSYRSYPIDEVLYNFLSSCLPSCPDDILIAPALLKKLIDERIVVKC